MHTVADDCLGCQGTSSTRGEGRGALPIWDGQRSTATKVTKARVSMGRQEFEAATTGKDQTAVLSILSTGDNFSV